jgi:hypothetical protein
MNLPKKFNEISYKLSILGISLFFVSFEVVRAIRTPFTLDEAVTYLNFISKEFLAAFNFNLANNHFLNTLLAKLFCAWGGSSELVLRLPNLLAYGVYLLFAFLILDKFVKTKIIILCGYLLLSLNPYVLDFFSLCRGYGLALGLMMAALFFFFSFLDKMIESRPAAYRQLRLSLLFAALAVLSNFSVLNVYLSLLIVAFGFFIVFKLHPCGRLPQLPPVQQQPRKAKIVWPVLLLAVVLFNLLAISYDFTLSGKLFEPVTVRIAGLDDGEKQEIDVSRLNIRDEETLLSYEDGLWRQRDLVYFKGLKFRCPPDILDRIKAIEISLGRKTFTFDAADLKRFKKLQRKKSYVFYSSYVVSLKRSRFPAFRPAINWKGDSAFLKILMMRILLVAGITALMVLLMLGAGRLLARWKILTPEQFRSLASTTLLLAVSIGYPIYMVKSVGDLIHGRMKGFIPDTVFPLIHNSFYGASYFPRQEQAVFLFIILSILGSFIALFVLGRKKSFTEVLPLVALLGILSFSSASTILQNILLATPYLLGRTAVFFIPLYLLLLIFLIQSLHRGKAALKVMAVTILVAVTALSVYHFYRTARTDMTMEWRTDAETKSLLGLLKELKEKDFAGRPSISLGVYGNAFPTLQYYLRRQKTAWLEINPTSPDSENDFYLFLEADDATQMILPRMILIKTFPLSRSILVKPKDEDGR